MCFNIWHSLAISQGKNGHQTTLCVNGDEGGKQGLSMNIFYNIINKMVCKVAKKICSLSLFLSLPCNIVIFLPQAPLASFNPIPHYYERNWSCITFNGCLGGVRTGKVPKP